MHAAAAPHLDRRWLCAPLQILSGSFRRKHPRKDGSAMTYDREQAWALLTRYNKEPFHLRHALTVEAVMGWYARTLGYEAEAPFWSMVGLLHDLDFEQWPEEHCTKAKELLAQEGWPQEFIHAVAQPWLWHDRCGRQAGA